MNLQVLFSVACLLGCASAAMQQTVPEYVAQDFTAENLFTSGIEGPCVAEDGMLYIVNFAKKGTIGKVEANGSASHFVDLPEGSTGNGIRTDHN
nr:hypothetical protein [Saprospiraceae bacterium]